MSAPLTFATFSPLHHGPEGLYRIGASTEGGEGVVQEMAQAFGHELTDTPDVDNLGQLINKVGPAKELQENIGRVQDILGTDQNAVAIARGWVERSELLEPVYRTFVGGETVYGAHYDTTVITGGIRNWMSRRADVARNTAVGWNIWLVAGNRVMRPAEGPDVREGMTEADYMDERVRRALFRFGIVSKLVAVASSIGDEVMAAGAERIAETTDLADPNNSVLLVSNAGAWVQNAGQLRRALRDVQPEFDQQGSQFSVLSDSFRLGTGTEPTSTHQNPFTALGQIARNAQELARHF